MNNRNRGFSAQPGSNRCNVFNINNQNIFINFQPIINNNAMNSMNNMNNQNIMMMNSQNEFYNMGGAQNFLMNNNMNPMYNNMNLMNMFNNRYDKNNNMMNK